LVNAIKFSPRESSLAISLSLKSSKVIVEVRDTGIGIDPEFIPFVFDRFRQENSKTTRKFGGLGLGLAIVKHLTTLHQGTIEAESDGLGKGALFRLSIPHQIPKPRWEHHWNDQWLSQMSDLDFNNSNMIAELPKGLTILVVEDDADSRHFVVNFLIKAGFEVTAAANAADARFILQSRSFNLLICDIGMPDEDGHAFMQWFRAYEKAQGRNPTQAIALTAFAAESDQLRAIESGFSLYVAKPFSPKRFLHTIQDLNLTH
jgi:CheY-like chemotaxis protein